LEKLAESPARDARAMAAARALEAELRGVPGARWMLEEHRVALFAQQLGTKGPTSEQKIRKALAG
jgi:ATP-dependent helicase HrpA